MSQSLQGGLLSLTGSHSHLPGAVSKPGGKPVPEAAVTDRCADVTDRCADVTDRCVDVIGNRCVCLLVCVVGCAASHLA